MVIVTLEKAVNTAQSLCGKFVHKWLTFYLLAAGTQPACPHLSIGSAAKMALVQSFCGAASASNPG